MRTIETKMLEAIANKTDWQLDNTSVKLRVAVHESAQHRQPHEYGALIAFICMSIFVRARCGSFLWGVVEANGFGDCFGDPPL